MAAATGQASGAGNRKLFRVSRGTAVVRLTEAEGGRPVDVAELQPGDCFGEVRRGALWRPAHGPHMYGTSSA